MSMAGNGIRHCACRLLLAAALALAGLAATAQEVGVAARVNGTEISVFRLERYFEDFLKERGRNLGTIRNPTAYKRLKREAMEELIERELLYQEAERRGIAVAAAEVEAARGRVAAGYRTPEAFQRRLRDAGFTEPAFSDYLRHQLMAERLRAELLQAAAPTEEEVRELYGRYRERFVQPQQVGAEDRQAAPAMPEAEALALVRRQLTAVRQAELWRQVLQELRQSARVEVLLPL